jgi:hypothetical protein
MWGLMFSGALCFSDRPFFLANRFYVPLLGGFLKPPALQVVAESPHEETEIQIPRLTNVLVH